MLVRITEMLFWYDGPQLAEAISDNENVFLIMAIPCEETQWLWLGAKVDNLTLQEFKSGWIDLLSVLNSKKIGGYYIGDGFKEIGEVLSLETFHGIVFDDWLPLPGLYLKDN